MQRGIIMTRLRMSVLAASVLCLWMTAGVRGQTTGSIEAWGYNIGDVPAPNTGFVAIAGGETHSLGLRSDGSMAAWGYNGDGQLNVPAPNTGFVAVAGGTNHSLGLKADGSIEGWGLNDSGQLDVPAPNSGFVAVAGGWLHSLGLRGCPADLNGDGVVNTQDFIAFLGAWANGDELADWNNDGTINTQDFLAYLNDWAAGCP